MTYQSPRVYLYKITFEEVPYYYYGVKKEKYFNEDYWGSPYSNRWCWDFYTPKKQILEIFPYTDEGWIEAQEVEKRIITTVFNTDKWCLNESCGGKVSLKILREAGKTAGNNNKKLNRGVCGMSVEERKKCGSIGGKIVGMLNKELKRGICGLSKEQRIEKARKGGNKAGNNNKKLNRGICGMSVEEKSEAGKKGSKNTNNQKWICLETGYITTSGPLTLYQKKRGIDISKRKKL